jgi:hypothetical protein
MQIVELASEDVGELILRPRAVSNIPRSPSQAHVSNIIRDIENAVLKPGQRKPYDQLSKEEKRRMGAYTSVGWAWEEVIRAAILASGFGPYADTERYITPGELHLDGIYGTPDWIDTVDYCVEEFKATYRSSRRPLDPDFWHWLVQIKAYCRLLQTTWARLRVFYVNGNYRDSGPQYKAYRLSFTALEIDDNWRMLSGHAKSKGWTK